jgi:Protein of unknown function (DUF2809)
MQFNRRSALIAIVILLVEILIATVFAGFHFIRGSVGDILVIVLLYHLIRACYPIAPIPLVIGLFVFACMVETAQYYGLAQALGFQRGSVGSILIGSTFSWEDIAMYAGGCILALISDRRQLMESDEPRLPML